MHGTTSYFTIQSSSALPIPQVHVKSVSKIQLNQFILIMTSFFLLMTTRDKTAASQFEAPQCIQASSLLNRWRKRKEQSHNTMGANVEESVGQNKYPICHLFGSLLSPSICNCQTNCQRMLQYIYDTSNEMDNRINTLTKNERNCQLFNTLLRI